jgi:hypothetical protein
MEKTSEFIIVFVRFSSIGFSPCDQCKGSDLALFAAYFGGQTLG